MLCSAWRLFEFSSTNELVIFNFNLSNLPRRSSFADAEPAVSPYVWILVFIRAPTWISGNNSPSSLDQQALLFPAPTPPHWQPITFQLPLMIILCHNNCHNEIHFCLFFLSWCFCAPVNDHGPETSEEEKRLRFLYGKFQKKSTNYKTTLPPAISSSSLVFYIYTELLSVKRKILHELKVFLQKHKPHKYLRLAVAPKHSHRFCRFTFQWNWVLDPGFVALGSSIKSLFLLVSQVQLKINNNRLKRKISELNQLFLHLRGICPPNIRRAQTERDEVITASYTCSSDLIKHESMHSAHMSLQCLQKHSPLQQNFQRLQPELHN